MSRLGAEQLHLLYKDNSADLLREYMCAWPQTRATIHVFTRAAAASRAGFEVLLKAHQLTQTELDSHLLIALRHGSSDAAALLLELGAVVEEYDADILIKEGRPLGRLALMAACL